MQTKLTLFILTFIAVTLGGTAAGTVRVTDVLMQKNSQFTEVTVVCDGQAEFTHQIVEAAANKPYRIVVDVKDAVTALPQSAFKSLPSGSIRQIRTSQYSTDPEKIVRIVLDVAGALTYKVNGDGSKFVLSINTPSDKNFSQWSAINGGGAVMATTEAKPAATVKTPSASEGPKPMPAHPDHPGKPFQSTDKAADQPGPQLANKPIDEGKLLTKVNKSNATPAAQPKPASETPKPAVKEETKAAPNAAAATATEKTAASTAWPATTKPAATVNPEVFNQIYGGTAQESNADKSNKEVTEVKPQPSPTTAAPALDQTAGQKRVDSAIIPQSKPSQSSPAMEPGDMAKPPKVQKTAFPETKVVKSPKYVESPEAGNALTGNIATSLDQQQPATATANQAGVEDSNSIFTKSEEVRQRYQASRNKAQQEEQPEYSTTATAGEEAKPLSNIDKIRLKYKRGIQFVENDQTEQQATDSDTEQENYDESQATQVGPYNEFLPERQIIVYQTAGRIDPFMPLLEDASSSAKRGDLPDVETLRLVGILQDRRSSRALFQDYNGYSYILKTGDRVKNGFVLAIEDTRVTFQIRQYGWNRQVAIDMDTEK